jgi:hypothetical protein
MQLEGAKLQLAGRKQVHKESVDGIQLAIKLSKASQDLNLNNLDAALSVNEAIQTNAQNLQDAQARETGGQPGAAPAPGAAPETPAQATP